MDLFQSFQNSLSTSFQSFVGLDWSSYYFFTKYLVITADVVFGLGIFWFLYRGFSYRLDIDMNALPPTFAQLLKNAGVRERYERRWTELRKSAKENPPESYKSAIIKADAVIDELVQEVGLQGRDTAERFGRLNSLGLKRGVVDAVFRAHRVRNDIAHSPDYQISENAAERVLDLYERFLIEAKLIV